MIRGNGGSSGDYVWLSRILEPVHSTVLLDRCEYYPGCPRTFGKSGTTRIKEYKAKNIRQQEYRLTVEPRLNL